MTDDLEPQIDYTKWLAELRTDLSESVAGVVLRGARPVPVGITQGGTKRPTTVSGALVGFALRNRSSSTTTNVVVYFYDGAGPDSDVILTVTLAPGESARDWFGPGGIHLGARGLYVEADGPIDGSVFLRGAE